MRWVGRIGFGLIVLAIAAFVALASWEPFFAQRSAEPPRQAYKAEIVRDHYGVPHIYGKTDADVAYGIAVAHAEDDFFTLQDTAAMTRGRYGAIAGPDGAAIDYLYHLLDARGTADRHYDNLPQDTQAIFNAYASGLNDYARDHPEEIKLANLFPVNGKDIAAGFALRQPLFYGLGNIILDLVEGNELRPEFGPPIPQADAKEARTDWPLPWGEMAALSGSNAFAIAPERSGDGVTRLVSNTHQPLRGGIAWYELVVESEQGWHFAGASLVGTPYPVMGHNRTLGFTWTVNRPDLIDIYELEVAVSPGIDGDEYRYLLDGEWRELERWTARLPVKLGPLVLPIEREFFRSAHGPVIRNDKGWFAIRYAGIDSIAYADAFYRLGKAENFEQWQAVMARMEIPSFNSVYADREGNIAYIYNAAFPNRKKGANWRTVLPGDDSSLIWQGTADFSEVPKQVNPASGWLFNANNAPWSAAGEADDLRAEDFAPELGVENKTTNRAWRAAKLLGETPVIDRQDLERIKYDKTYERRGYIADMLDDVAALDLSDDPGLGRAQALLAEWDLTSDNVGRADALAYLLLRDFMSAEYQNKPLPDVREKLAAATAHLETHFGRLDPPLSDLLRLRQGDVDLPLIGGSDTLRASTIWRVDDDGRLQLVHGDSFLMFVEWPPGERVFSESVQPFGAATTRPESPHYTDQMELYVNQQLKPVHFWRENVLANAARRYTVESN
ncbi:acylase [Altererythrobacter sp. MF3-039]|uniref:acylase n=1 Tax=Altererythrobacter sp. MF3-039 TaxID=3252901 RepID=UPI00390CD5EC